MTDLQLIKIAVHMVKTMKEITQSEVGVMIGYSSGSAFSQVLNGTVPIPGDFIERLASLDDDIKKFILESRQYKKVNNETENKTNQKAALLHHDQPSIVEESTMPHVAERKKPTDEKIKEYLELKIKADKLLAEILTEQSKKSNQ